MTLTPVDDVAAAATQALSQHLTAPFAAGAARTVLPIDGAGHVQVDFAARRPLVLLALRRALDGRRLTAVGTVDGAAASGPPLEFAPWSDAGSELLLYRPPRAAGAERVPAFGIGLALTMESAAVPAADVATWVDAVLIEGDLGRLLAVLGSETGRLRREARELRAMRTLDAARADALDRIGADLGVPRLDSALEWHAATREIVARPAPEADAEYRTRLRMFRRFVAPTPAGALAVVGGPGGPVPEMRLREPGDPLAIALQLVALGPTDAPRQALLARVRADWLILPNADAASEALHQARFLPAARKVTTDELRTRLRTAFAFPADAAIAPRLAAVLDRAGRVLTALGGAPVLQIARAQDSAGGSRYELGLGVDLVPPAAADANALHATLMGARNPGVDAEAEALVRAARAAAPPADGTLDWLWKIAGLPTAHRLPHGHVYLSHLKTAGLAIEGPSTTADPAEYRAIFHAPGDPGLNAALASALARAEAERAASGAPAFARINSADAQVRWDTAIDLPQGHVAVNVLVAAGLRAPERAAAVAQGLRALPPDLLATLALTADVSQQIRDGDPAAIPPLTALVHLLRASGVTSLLPLVTPAEVLVVAGVASLPVAGVNLGERRATGIRWSAVGLGGTAGLGPVGARTMLRPEAVGLVAVIALGYVRDGAPDPYEIRCELPEGALLDLRRYELLMNGLECCFPVGVEVNTWPIRQRHVDLDGDGVADPLPPALARHYRRFRMPRLRGLEEPGVAAP